MSIYKTWYMRGRQCYSREGKIVSKIDVPENVLAILENAEAGTTVEEDAHQLRTKTPEGEKTIRTCVFCGAKGVRTRFVLAQTVSLCEDHYQNKTLGETAYIMKEKGYGPKEEIQDAQKEESRVLAGASLPRQQFDGEFAGMEDDRP